MKLLEIINQPWGITPARHDQIIRKYENLITGEKVDFGAIMRSAEGLKKAQNVINGNAVVAVKGTLNKESSFFSFFFDSGSMVEIKNEIQKALDDSQVKRIILDIDSPGGTVDGAFELADFINEARQQKPIIAFSDGMIASAAYLIAASTDEIHITGKTNQVGSIGVIARHVDFSGMDSKDGITVTEIVTGEFKNVFSRDKPLSELGKQTMQEQVNYVFSLFVADIAERRPALSAESIVAQEARVFIGQQSIEAGLVDSVSTLDQLTQTGSAPKILNSKETMNQKLTLEQLKTENPELYEQIKADAEKNGSVSATTGERKRIKEIRSMAFPGQEEIVERMIDEGKSASDAAIIFNAAQREVLNAAAEVINADAPEPVIIEPAPEPDAEETKKDWDMLLADHMKATGATRREAIKHCAANHEAEHQAWLDKINK
jgi:capsid assembly protease